ncbi:N-acetylmuramoyl-L-alanine amidase [Palleronia aestuarii]|uniref:N-acetylmuramoyl-L-alanine amidase n=1 Tax=Palleronia aestuarii TaxID=568105 RepID=A0A2W7NIY1_9RHOB|nr:N-acetylmuramoyl-L-alanine amidase [Palleronia aestuarii]PZX19830.1 N-acetylmuramoyl-L-alanine amidase [Palleronia aestuarii]
MRDITEIIVHCSATRPTFMQGQTTKTKVAEIRRWHIEDRKWSNIGYHLLIDRDGTIANGRDMTRTGAHVQGHNTGTIGICLFGAHGAAATDRFSDHFTAAQDKALRYVIADLRSKYGALLVSGHNQYANKGCPGFFVPDWLDQEKTESADPVEVARWRLAAIRDAATAALTELPNPA